MVFVMSNTRLGFELSNLIQANTFLLEEFVELEWVVSRIEAVVGGSIGLFEARVLYISIHSALEHSTEINPREDTIVGHKVVSGVGFITISVGETGSI